MKNKLNRAVVLTMMGIFAVAIAAQHEEGAVHPAKISKSDAAGQIFDREDMLETTHDDGHVTLDVTTLLGSDGTVTQINAGEGVTIPKEWTGTWDTDGYTKIWVIYSEDGSGL